MRNEECEGGGAGLASLGTWVWGLERVRWCSCDQAVETWVEEVKRSLR